MMAYGIRSAMARWVGDNVPGQGRSRAALVLRIENSGRLRASLGPAALDRMMDIIAARLSTDLRFAPLDRHAGQTELCGLLADRSPGALPGHLARLGVICRAGIDLGDMRVVPVVNAVIVSDVSGAGDTAQLYAHGRAALAACSPLTDAGQIRFVEYAQDADVQAEPPFLPDQIVTRFQPQICCDTGRILALRAVPQLDHPELGLMDLADLQPRLAGDVVADCGRAVLRQALSALRGWDRAGLDVPFVSLPLGDCELADPTLADTILWELDRLDLLPNRLEIEIAQPIGHAGGRVPVTMNLQRLGQAGCLIAMGEFGTGSAGLDDLRIFGMHRVRIGRAFVAGCDRRPDQQRMILAILALAEHLKLRTLADGATTAEERAFLSQIGFDAVQGKAVAAPLAPDKVQPFLTSHQRSLPQLFDIRRKA